VVASGILSQDTIQNRVRYVLQVQHPDLARTKALGLLLLVAGKLYDAGRGNVFRGVVRIAHSQLASHETVRCSRNWACQSLKALELAGWLQVTYLRRPDGKFDPGIYRIGPQLKRIVVALLKLHFPNAKGSKKSGSDPTHNHHVNSKQQSSPSRMDRNSFTRLLGMVKAEIDKARGLPAP
jgi:hypothetical protein